MIPHAELISNSDENSCLADIGREYLVYVKSASSVRVDLRSLGGSAKYCVYDPVDDKWTSLQTVRGGDYHTFKKPGSMDD
jgi:hypothetical protein